MIVKAPLPDIPVEELVKKQRPMRKQELWPPIFSNTLEMEEPNWVVHVWGYLSTIVLLLCGYMRDFLRWAGIEKSHVPCEDMNEVRFM